MALQANLAALVKKQTDEVRFELEDQRLQLLLHGASLMGERLAKRRKLNFLS